MARYLPLLAAALGLSACTPRSNTEACRRTCPSFGIEEASACEELCTTPCKELAQTYGMDEEQCRRIQSGELAPPG